MPAENKITFKCDDKTFESLKKISYTSGMNMSAVIRKLLNIGLDKELAKESIDFVREQINEEIKSTCFPQFERLAKLSAKIGYQSVSDFYLLSYIMDSILPPTKRQDFDEIKKKSKAMAIAYLKLSENEFADFVLSEDISLEKLDFKKPIEK
ncbi:MAG: hypothetical protein RSE07_02515 [Oscillospiraceae bacterium]